MNQQPVITSAEARVDLPAVVEYALKMARRQGADAASAGVSLKQGFDISVRLGEIENVQHVNNGSLSVTVYVGKKTGSSTTSDLSQDAVADAVRAAYAIARYTAEDPCNGLPPKNRLAREFADLEQFVPWHIRQNQAVELARDTENYARSYDKNITNSEGAGVHTEIGEIAFGNTDDFFTHKRITHHEIACSVLGGSNSGMQRDSWYSSSLDPKQLESPKSIGEMAAKRTLNRLNARRIDTCEVPVLFEAPIASSLLSHFIGAIHGSALYKRASFLLDSLGEHVFPDKTRIHEQPHLKRIIGSSYCDAEGVATQPRDIVSDGILRGYVLSSYSARKLGLETTGNAGGTFNLTIDTGERDFEGMLKLMNRGLLVTELIGFGVNKVTGDYSRGASGFWVERGEIQYPVEQLTIAGNLKDMFRSIIEVGSDVDLRKSTRTGSILVSNMAVAGR